MAKLHALPSQAVIDGFKGVIDFYMNYQTCDRSIAGAGIPCARSWPRSPGHDRAPSVKAGWDAFAWAAKNWNSLDPYVQEAYRLTAQESNLTPRDLFMKGYITDYFREGQWDILSKDPEFTPEENVMLPSLSAYMSANRTDIPTNTVVVVPFDTEEYDIGGNFDPVTHRYTAPRAGRYLVIASLLWFDLIVDARYDSEIYVNGVRSKVTIVQSTVNSHTSAICTAILNLSEGDFIEIVAWHQDGTGNPDLYSANDALHTFFNVAIIE